MLVGERLNYRDIFQFPRGGIDEGEDPVAAGLRELWEETGLEPSEPAVFEIDEWLRYDFPPDIPKRLKNYAGQEQKWFFYYWDGGPRKKNAGDRCERGEGVHVDRPTGRKTRKLVALFRLSRSFRL